MLAEALLFLSVSPFLNGGEPGEPGEKPAEPSTASALQDPDTFRFYWKDGLRAGNDNGIELRLGGRIHADAGWIANEPAIEAAVGDTEDGFEFRRARLYMSGELPHDIGFKAQFDFAGGDADFKDVYISYGGWPVKVQVGQFKEPFSLEELISSNYMTFMERSLNNVFVPARNTGLMLSNSYDEDVANLTWGLGLFRSADSFGDAAGDGEWSVTGRTTVAPIHDEEQTLHLGVNASLRSPAGDMVSYSTEPEAHLAPDFLATGTIMADSNTVLGIEGAYVYDRYSVQIEYIQADPDVIAGTGPDVTLSGWYVEGSAFLTEDRRPYDAKKGTFGRLKPSGEDAIEAKLRYSTLDFSDIASGLELSDITAGVNWYLSPNTRLMAEVIHADIDGLDSTQIAQIRFQVDW